MTDYISFDLETTGLSSVQHEIIEIGAWKVQDSIVVSKFSTLVKPLGRISLDIQRLTGITPDMVADACSIEEIMPSFIDFCGDLPLLGYSLPFDYEFICRKAKPMGYDFTLDGNRAGIDVLSLCRKYVKNRHHKLQEMAEYFGVAVNPETANYHRAEFDAYVTKLIYDRFVYTSESIPNVTIPQLLSKEFPLYGKAVRNETLSFE